MRVLSRNKSAKSGCKNQVFRKSAGDFSSGIATVGNRHAVFKLFCPAAVVFCGPISKLFYSAAVVFFSPGCGGRRSADFPGSGEAGVFWVSLPYDVIEVK